MGSCVVGFFNFLRKIRNIDFYVKKFLVNLFENKGFCLELVVFMLFYVVEVFF